MKEFMRGKVVDFLSKQSEPQSVKDICRAVLNIHLVSGEEVDSMIPVLRNLEKLKLINRQNTGGRIYYTHTVMGGIHAYIKEHGESIVDFVETSVLSEPPYNKGAVLFSTLHSFILGRKRKRLYSNPDSLLKRSYLIVDTMEEAGLLYRKGETVSTKPISDLNKYPSWDVEFSPLGLLDLIKTLTLHSRKWRSNQYFKDAFEEKTKERLLLVPFNFVFDVFLQDLVECEAVSRKVKEDGKVVYKINTGIYKPSDMTQYSKELVEMCGRSGVEKSWYEVYVRTVRKTLKKWEGKNIPKPSFMEFIKKSIKELNLNLKEDGLFMSFTFYSGLKEEGGKVTIPDVFVSHLSYKCQPEPKQEVVEVVTDSKPVKEAEPPKPPVVEEVVEQTEEPEVIEELIPVTEEWVPEAPVGLFIQEEEVVVSDAGSKSYLTNHHENYAGRKKLKPHHVVPTAALSERARVEREVLASKSYDFNRWYNDFWTISSFLSQYLKGAIFNVDHAKSYHDYKEEAIHPNNLQILTERDNKSKNSDSWTRMTLEEQKDYIRKAVYKNRGELSDFEKEMFEVALSGLDVLFRDRGDI